MQDQVVDNYETYWSRLRSTHHLHPANRLRYRLIRREILRYVSSREGAPLSLIDVGCGDGSLLHELGAIAPWQEVSGIDIARQNIPHEFYQMDLGSTEWNFDRSKKFDVVVCSEVIEHVPNDSQGLKNLVGLAKPGGLIILTTQSGPMFRMDREILGHLRHYSSEDIVNRFSSVTGVRAQCRRHGFPFLSLQKRIVDMLFQFTRDRVLVGTPGRLSRFIFNTLSLLYTFELPGLGPQLVLACILPQED